MQKRAKRGTYITTEYLMRARIERILNILHTTEKRSLSRIATDLCYHPSATVRLLKKLIDSGLVSKPSQGKYQISNRLLGKGGVRVYLPFLDSSPNHIWVDSVNYKVYFSWCSFENGEAVLQEWGSFSKHYGYMKKNLHIGEDLSWIKKIAYRVSSWLVS